MRDPITERQLAYQAIRSDAEALAGEMRRYPVQRASAGRPALEQIDLSLILSTPTFWLGIVLILLFADQLRWLPASGTGTWRNLVRCSDRARR